HRQGTGKTAKAGSGQMKGRDFLDLIDIPAQELRGIIEASRAMKARRERAPRPLEGRTLALIFDKPSTRTRASFDVAMRQLGGAAGPSCCPGGRCNSGGVKPSPIGRGFSHATSTSS